MTARKWAVFCYPLLRTLLEYIRQQDAPQAGIYRKRQRNINRRQRDAPAPRAGICPQEAAGCSTGRNMSGGDSRMLHRQGYTGGGRGTSTGCSRMLHRQEYIRKMQQDAPQAGIYRRRQRNINRRQRDAPAPRAGIYPEEAAGCSTGMDIPEEAEEHQQEAAGCSIVGNISGRCSRMFHRQEYVRRRQQETP